MVIIKTKVLVMATTAAAITEDEAYDGDGNDVEVELNDVGNNEDDEK